VTPEEAIARLQRMLRDFDRWCYAPKAGYDQAVELISAAATDLEDVIPALTPFVAASPADVAAPGAVAEVSTTVRRVGTQVFMPWADLERLFPPKTEAGS